MNEGTAAVARSISAATAAAARMIDKAVDHAVTELQAAEAQAASERRHQIADAWRELLARRPAWADRFPRLLRAALEEEARRDPEGDVPAPPEPSSGFMALTLVDDGEIARKIESSRLAQQLTSALERPLAELDALMSSAIGLDVIQPERNPLRPAVLARVLRNLMGEQQPDPAWTGLWLRHMVQPLAQELGQLYAEQATQLAQAQVQAANYRLVTVPSAPGRGSGGGAAAARAATPNAPAASQAGRDRGCAELPLQAVDGPRLRQFLTRDDPQAHQPVAPRFRAQAEAELRALEEAADTRSYDADAARHHLHLPVVERPPRRVDTDSPLPEAVWGEFGSARRRSLVRGRLKTQAREVGQVYGLEVVRRLLDKVAEDPRLLAPVREALIALEPSLSRLAMVAPRFFSDEAHPGRLLVERVAERSFKYNDEFSVEFQGFMVPVAQTFSRLNGVEKFDNAIPFQAALAALQAGWRAQDTLDEEAQRRVLETVQHAERRQQEAERIAADLRGREDLVRAPQGVQDFVLSTWTVVIAHARLCQKQGGMDPGGYLAVIADLLWSVDRDLALHEPARAFVLIPRVLLKLREGLATLGQQPGESDAFFHQLERLHRPILKLRAKHRHRDMAPAEPAPDSVPAAAARPPDQPWMAADDLRAAGFEDTPPSDFGALPAAHRPTQAPVQPLEEHEAEHVVSTLTPGCWVDLYSRQQWRRARLVWAGQKGTLFMFVSQGGQPHSMTRRSIQRLARDRLLRAVAGDGVVPRALERLGQPSAPMPLAA